MKFRSLTRATLACALVAAMTTGRPLLADQHKEDAAHGHAAMEKADIPKHGVTVLMPMKGSKVSGTIAFEQKGDAVHLTGKVMNLSPGKHGFHVHEFGDLRAEDGTSAGGHYAPDGSKHGGPDDSEHHSGDLGNIVAGQDGTATIDITAKHQSLHLWLGRALVVHGDADDLSSQPSGNAGPRVAVGVIGIANSEAKK